MRTRKPAALLATVLFIISENVRADVGLPMLILVWPAYILAFVPVVGVEAFVGVRRLGLGWRVALATCAVGNLWSTLLGVPIVWLALLALEFLVASLANALPLSSAWEYVLFPFMIAWIGGESVWMLYLAFVLLAFPFCVASIWIERKVALRRLPELPAQAVREWVRDANIWSYVLLVAVALIYPVAVAQHAT
jgi:hypothetical protein